MTPWDETLSASPCTTTNSINIPASPSINPAILGYHIQVEDKIPKRFGGKDLSMHDINKLRYKRTK